MPPPRRRVRRWRGRRSGVRPPGPRSANAPARIMRRWRPAPRCVQKSGMRGASTGPSPVPVGVVGDEVEHGVDDVRWAAVGPTSIHDRAARSSERSSVMRGVLRGRWLGIGPQRVAQADERVVQSRSGRARGDLQQLGDLHERQPEVVVQDEDRPLVDRKPAERPLQLVAIDDPSASSGVVGPSMGRTRTFAVHWRDRCDSS